ncbi:unnamed protein product [Rotaria sp. Silwood1]|nr:unnamed protein product [Rotaria sp. Silwood1]
MISAIKTKQVNFNELWPIVLSTVRSVINMSQYGHTDKSTWHTRFFDIYDLCAATPDSYAERLYEETKKFLEDHCRSMEKDIAESEQNTLSIYVKNWTEYKMGAEHLNSLYAYLNNTLVKKHQVIDPGNNMMLEYNIELDDQSPVEIGEVKFNLLN